MDWGLRNRISRILQPQDGRTVMLAVDHGYFLGPTHRLEDPRATIAPLLPHADAVMLTRGVLRTSVDPDTGKPMVLRVSGGTSVLQEDLSKEAVTTSVKEALRLNASAVALSIFIGAPHEHESIVNLAHLVNEAEGVPEGRGLLPRPPDHRGRAQARDGPRRPGDDPGRDRGGRRRRGHGAEHLAARHAGPDDPRGPRDRPRESHRKRGRGPPQAPEGAGIALRSRGFGRRFMPGHGTPSHGDAMLAKKLGGEEAARRWWTDVAARVAAAPDAEEAVRQLESAIARDVDPYAFGTFLENPADHHLVLKHRFAHGPLRDEPIAVHPEQGMVGFVFRHGVPLVVHDVSKDPRYLRGPLADAASALAVPVRSGRETLGALDIEADETWSFDAADVQAMEALGAALGAALARARTGPAPPPP